MHYCERGVFIHRPPGALPFYLRAQLPAPFLLVGAVTVLESDQFMVQLLGQRFPQHKVALGLLPASWYLEDVSRPPTSTTAVSGQGFGVPLRSDPERCPGNSTSCLLPGAREGGEKGDSTRGLLRFVPGVCSIWFPM
jgi:hypothetical protein